MEQLGNLPWNQITFPKLGLEFNVGSDAFTVFGLTIKWYGIIIALGLLLALIYCFRRMEHFGLDGDKVIDAVFAGIIGGIVGARLYYIAFNLDQYRDIKEILSIRSGGLAIFGGLIGAILCGGITAKVKKIKLPPLLDIASMGFLIGQGIGRWGNFFNHEAFGTNTDMPWGMSSGKIQQYLLVNMDTILEETGITVDPYRPVHPCFLYESLWCLLGFLLLHLYYKKRKYDGEMFLLYVCWYGLERMIVEGLRTDSLFIGPFRVSQMLAGLLFVSSLTILIVNHFRFKKNGVPELYVNTEESKAILKAAKESEEAAGKKAAKGKELSADQHIIIDDDEEIKEDIENGKDN